ncbi:MAG: hypothetical protein QXX64_03330, partial [Nitrososphaera sp.]
IITHKDKQKWQTLGNVKAIDPKDPRLLKARAVATVKDARQIIENCLTGKIDKAKAKAELSKVIDKVCP